MSAAFGKPITVIELSDSGLIRERWVFSLQGQRLVLDRYHYERRYATTQPFKTTKFYDRLREDEEYGDWVWLTEDGVPWDEELQSQAIGELMSRVRVVRQSDLSPASRAPSTASETQEVPETQGNEDEPQGATGAA
jgi:hypothetical protein